MTTTRNAMKLTRGLGYALTRDALFLYWGKRPMQCLIAFRLSADLNSLPGFRSTSIGPVLVTWHAK